LQSKAQNAVNPNGLTSILTRQCEKSALKNGFGLFSFAYMIAKGGGMI